MSWPTNQRDLFLWRHLQIPETQQEEKENLSKGVKELEANVNFNVDVDVNVKVSAETETKTVNTDKDNDVLQRNRPS